MNKSHGQLTKRKLAVIDDLFAGNIEETAILHKHKISNSVYKKWLTEKSFIEELEFRIASAKRQSRVIIAKYAPIAAAKLIELTQCEKEETARKACLDIISMPTMLIHTEDCNNDQNIKEQDEDKTLSPELTNKLLSALAEGRSS